MPIKQNIWLLKLHKTLWFWLNLQINRIPLSRVGNKCDETSTKFLGIHIGENLSWKRHICQLNSKIARASFAINQVKNVLPKESLKTLYFALIQP